jgi:hypothetical protein
MQASGVLADAGDLGSDLVDVLPGPQWAGSRIESGDRCGRSYLMSLVAEPAILGDQLELSGVPAFDDDPPVGDLGEGLRGSRRGFDCGRGRPVEGE